MPEEVKDVFGHAIDLAQTGGKYPDTKVMAVFGSAGVLEVVENHQGDTFRAVYTVIPWLGLCSALLSEESQKWYRYT